MPSFTQSHQVNMEELNNLASYLGVSSGKLVLDAKEQVTDCHFDNVAWMFNMGIIIKINKQCLKQISIHAIGSMVNMFKPISIRYMNSNQHEYIFKSMFYVSYFINIRESFFLINCFSFMYSKVYGV